MPDTNSLTTGTKKPTNVTLDRDLLATARALKINISRAAERGLAAAIAEARAAEWQDANRAALESSNAYVEAHGLPLAKYRNF